MSKFFFTVLSFFFLTLGTSTLANDVLTAQQLLTKLGYNPGPIDGSYGGKTEKALIKFYAKQDKKFDGIVDKNELIFLQSFLNKTDKAMPKLPKGKSAKITGKKKALPLLKALILKEVRAVDLSDYDLCRSLMYADFVDTFREMKKRNLDCLYISQKQTGWKPNDRNEAFKYLRRYQKRYNIEVPDYNLETKIKPFGSVAQTTEIYEMLNPDFRNQILSKIRTNNRRIDFCYDWFPQVAYIAENQSKNIDGSQSWLEDSLRDGFVICQNAFNTSYLAALFSKDDLSGIKHVLETWINNDAPRRDVETPNNIFGYILLINKSFAALEMLKDEFNWSDEFNVRLNKWIKVRALELFPTDRTGKHLTSYCKHRIRDYKDQKEACKNGGILRAQALLRAGIFTNDPEFIEMAYIAFHRYMSGIRKDGSVAGDSVRGCTAADYNIWATQFMSDFHALWMQIGSPLWDFRVKDFGSVKESIEYSLDLRENFELINKYTWDDEWKNCGDMRKDKIQQATLRSKDYYPLESFGSYFFTFKPNISKKFFGNSYVRHGTSRYTSQSGSNYEVSYLYTHPELTKGKREEAAKLAREAREIAEKIQKKKEEEELEREALKRQSNEIVPVSFKNVYVKVSKREGNYQDAFIELSGLTVGSEEYKSLELNLMIDYAEKSSSRDLIKLFRIQVPADGLIPEFALPNLEECKKIAWKTTNNGITITFLIGNESERNLCVLRTMYPEKRNFLGSIANVLPEILEAGLAKDKEQLEAILFVLKDAQR